MRCRTTTTEVRANQHEALAALPWASADDVHPDPMAAVQAFIAWAGYDNVVVGDFAQGDARSGEVEFWSETASSDGRNTDLHPVTTVFVRQAGPDDTWWVLGAQSEDVVVTAPAADATIGSPVTIEFTTMTMSGGVTLHVYAEGSEAPLVEGVGLTGGGVFALGDFSQEVEFTGPEGGPGTLVFFSDHGLTTVPVQFATP